MKLTRITAGVAVSLLGWVVLFSLWAVRYDYKWNSLGVWYRDAAKVADIDLPIVIKLLWPFAPAAWWGWLSPFAFGVFAAFRVRHPWRLSTRIAAVCGAFLLTGVVWSTLVTYTRMTFHMGTPQPEPVEATSLAGNIVLLAVGIGLAVLSVLRDRGVAPK